MKPTETPSANSRAVAADIVAQWIKTEEFPDRLIARVDKDRAFIMEMVFGIARQRRLLEWVIGRCAERPPDVDVMACLLVGIYQLLLLDDVEDYAAVNETVEAVKAGPVPRSAGFVNGVLRTVLRERARIRDEILKLSPGIRWSHPDVLVDRWIRNFGEPKALALCQWNNSRPQVTLRPNLRKIGAPELLRSLRDAGIAAEPHPYLPDLFINLPHGAGVMELPGFAQGAFSVQDPSTALSVDLLDPQPGERVLDACAAPGGKTLVAAEKMKGRGVLVAMDVVEERLARVRENVLRLGLDCVQVVCGDATSPNLGAVCGNERFDRIILDVPCSNTGVLRRRPDARWRFSLTRLAQLMKIQRAMLDNVIGVLKPGGRLVYSTCSLEPQEGAMLVEAWLAAHPEYSLLQSVALFPPDTQTDGIYAAALACHA